MMGDTPSQQVLHGVTCYVDTMLNDEVDCSKYVKLLCIKLGAKVEDEFTEKVTHVVLKRGKIGTFTKALKNNVPMVSTLWLDECAKFGGIVDPALHPPTCFKEYNELVQAEEAGLDGIEEKKSESTSMESTTVEHIPAERTFLKSTTLTFNNNISDNPPESEEKNSSATESEEETTTFTKQHVLNKVFKSIAIREKVDNRGSNCKCENGVEEENRRVNIGESATVEEMPKCSAERPENQEQQPDCRESQDGQKPKSYRVDGSTQTDF